MPQRKPRPRKGKSAAARSGSRRGGIGLLWWGAGALAIGWIAFDANRPAVERHWPQIAAIRLPWDEAPKARPAARPAAPAHPSAAAADPVRRLIATSTPSKPAPERAADTRQAALRAPAPTPKSALPEARPARPAPVVPMPARVQPAAPGAGGLVTRSALPLRRAPEAGAPAWMVLEPGRPLRVTARQGGFARVESGIFTGWVEADLVSPAVPAARTATRSTMPVLAAGSGRAGPVPTASVPARP